MKLKAIRDKKQITATELAIKTGTTKDWMSRFENYKCIPIPDTLKKICDILECSIFDIYNKNEINFFEPQKNDLGTAKRLEYEQQFYKLTVRLPKDCCNLLQQHNLHKCGYRNLCDFIFRCVFEFKNKLQVIELKEHQSNDTYIPEWTKRRDLQ